MPLLRKHEHTAQRPSQDRVSGTSAHP